MVKKYIEDLDMLCFYTEYENCVVLYNVDADIYAIYSKLSDINFESDDMFSTSLYANTYDKLCNDLKENVEFLDNLKDFNKELLE